MEKLLQQTVGAAIFKNYSNEIRWIESAKV